MEQIPSYNLLQAIDPTKIKVPISDRFAKLTLSSNKKQQEKDQPDQVKIQEKRKSVSRNISKQFDDEEKEINRRSVQNPLLRSESSKETECKNYAKSSEDNLTMEPLEVSEDYDNTTQMDDELELLSQRIISMVVESKPVSISSDSTVNQSDLTEFFSSESQRSSINEAKNIHIVHNIPINIEEALKQEAVALNLTSSNNENIEKTYEMTDDDDDDGEYEEESEIIIISDTSESHHEEENIILTSPVASTYAESENLRLPSLIDDKTARVVAFLRDVSTERRVMVEEGNAAYNDTVDRILDNQEISKKEQNITKSQQIATADTESMTPDVDEEYIPRSLLERQKRINALGSKSSEIYIQSEDTYKTQDDMANTPKIPKSTNTPLKDCNPGTSKVTKRDAYRIANDETQCGSEYSLSEEASKTLQNTEKSRRVSYNKSNNNDSRRLANEDTMADSISDIEIQDYKTPRTHSKNDDYKYGASISLLPTSKSPTDYVNKHDSFASIINSSSELSVTVPEHSIMISETDDENLENELPSPPKSHKSDEQKLSNSFHRDDSTDESEYEEQTSKIQMSMASINISAKINIKIHIPNTRSSSETSEDDQNYKRNIHGAEDIRKGNNKEQKIQKDIDVAKAPPDNHRNTESTHQSNEYEQPENLCKQMQLKAPLEKIFPTSSSSPVVVETKEDEKFVADAEKLLNQLYGKSWQTPDVIRTLKRSSQSGDKKSQNKKSLPRKQCAVSNSNEENSKNKSPTNDTILGDFSIFRRNIVKTNLDSTRLRTPKTDMCNKEIFSELRNSKVSGYKEKLDERKPVSSSAGKVVINNRRVDNGRWRQLIDNDTNSEGDNASDDDDADISWSRNASELELETSDSDFEDTKRAKARKMKNNTTTRQIRSEKSDYLTKILNRSKDGEIVYLDLSKEEVEVQDEATESPPANHDVTFASRLQDILKSCRHEDKPKLPTSNKKTKRKLFTPKFGDDDIEAVVATDDIKIKENITKTYSANSDNEIMEDTGNQPFDSQGRLKVLDVVNKKLESVKGNAPIFLLTPPSRKKNTPLKSNNKSSKMNIENTPETKSGKNVNFKTPLTVKSRGPAKLTTMELLQTPVFKYSFLKSLDVTVSRTLCHPDALCYRDNYRTKKEDLTKILYDMYNEKLFANQLGVPVTWNKKLLNTAGRCLNKKKLGVRTSVIELSDKVLTSADRLRCTLIHELCHAATWIFSGEGGHGSTWKEWARRANAIFPEIPKIGVCHQYDIEYKYTYKCTLCGAKSHAHSKSKKVENIRCSYCHGAIEIFLNKKDKDGNVMPTPVKEPTGFAKFVKDNYQKFKRDDLKHADVMKLLSSEFASLKVAAT